MEISQHIKDLLFTHDRVILSGFGAFIAKYSPAKINEETKTITPPSKEIIFDSKVIKDGGLLEKHMSEREKIAVEESTKQIDEFVKTVISKLNAGKKVKFSDLGTFSKSAEGIIEFKYEPAGNLLLDSYGLPQISLPDKIHGANKEVRGRTKMSATQPVDDGTSEVKPSKTTNYKKIILISIPLALILVLVALYFLKPGIWKKGSEYVSEIFNGKGQNNDSTYIEGNDTLIVDQGNPNTYDTGGNEIVQNDVSDTVKHSESHEKEPIVKPDEKPVINPENNSSPINNSTTIVASGNVVNPVKGKYYLIIGSLPEMELAKKESDRYRKIGIPTNIIPAGESRFRISLGEFNSPKEASAFYDSFHTKHKNINPWLWENR